MKKLLVALLAVSFLSACVPLIVAGGAAMGLWIGSDPRKSDVIRADFDMGAQLEAKIIDTYKERVHVNVNVFNNVVLLTGEAADDAAKQHVEQLAWQMKRKPREVYNELVLAAASSMGDRSHDSALGTRVKTAILADATDPAATHIMVVTERSVVYLMGVSKRTIIDRAAQAASKVSGVKQVVTLIEVEPEGPTTKP